MPLGRFSEFQSGHFASVTSGASVVCSPSVILNIPSSLKWMPPPLGVIKLNVDVAVRSRKSFVGIVVRDCRGVLHLGAIQESNFNIKAAEAKAVLWALELALEQGRSSI